MDEINLSEQVNRMIKEYDRRQREADERSRADYAASVLLDKAIAAAKAAVAEQGRAARVAAARAEWAAQRGQDEQAAAPSTRPGQVPLTEDERRAIVLHCQEHPDEILPMVATRFHCSLSTVQRCLRREGAQRKQGRKKTGQPEA